mmetsp:Transcript_5285/g.10871  ORF Transcript_5285/g.10871 Transcript_5285/m.10871 type:complete len:217 (-) Transcript_5285:48-698(-)|eukprot:CAMPEP_0168748158 /NCGR_PEP_ID=MMETSP0724-20121128/16031_1 /TAXON_ID=265536 /ORGANISM="Amphiprora sp., Strain CCMP467" /LENGTH=216 /DNA_ID=CAMNT_0008795977 /DNA_START=12 /DNA_END=662 /DNA_ORIENTATION=+
MILVVPAPTNNNRSSAMIIGNSSEDPALVQSCRSLKDTRSSQPRKCVSFGAQILYTAPLQHLDVPVNELWYTPVDFRSMRLNYKYDMKRVTRKPKSNATAVDKTIIDQAFAECLESAILSPHVASNLAEYFATTPQCIGLERTTSKRLFQEKKERRQLVVQAMQRIQEEMRSFENNNYRDDPKVQDMGANLIRLACENITRPTVLFAHQLAVAACP